MQQISFKYIFLSVLCLLGQLNYGQHGLFEHYDKTDGLNSNKVFGIAESPDGTIWFATNKGISKYDGGSFTSLDLGKKEDIVFAILPVQDQLWVHSYPDNISILKNNNELTRHSASTKLSELISDRLINQIVIDQDRNAWVSTVIGGELFKIEGDQVIKLDRDTNSAFSFFLKQIGNKALICGSSSSKTISNRLQVNGADADYYIDLTASEGFSKSSCTMLSNGDYLFAKGQEIIRCNQSNLINRTFVGKNVETLFEDSEGKIWIGLHRGGVSCFPSGNLAPGEGIPYLGSYSVSSVLEDRNGNIWIGTHENGVYMLPGIPTLDFVSPTLEKNTDTTINTINAIRSEASDRIVENQEDQFDTIAPVIPQVYISGVSIMNRDTLIQDHYELPYDMNFLKIDFIGFSGNIELEHYKYRLTGVNKEWVYTSDPSVVYSLLPPGQYEFNVLTMNRNGDWSETPARFTFAISPAIWNTWLFRATFIIALGLGIWLLLKNRIKQVERKNETDRKLIELEQRALRAQMNPHFIFNSLNSVQSFIANKNTESAEKYLSSFSKLMRQILSNSRAQFIALENEINTLRLYLELEKMRFSDKLNWNIIIDEEIEQDLIGIPPMLIQPHVENAILHGIMNKQEPGLVTIGFVIKTEVVHCTITDDGVGRKRAMELKQQSKLGHKSAGLTVTGERIELLNSIHGKNISISVIDLESEQGEALGTKVELSIPYINMYESSSN